MSCVQFALSMSAAETTATGPAGGDGKAGGMSEVGIGAWPLPVGVGSGALETTARVAAGIVAFNQSHSRDVARARQQNLALLQVKGSRDGGG